MMETILIAEDDDAFRFLTNRILVRAGYTVIESKDGEECLQTARDHDGPIHLLCTNVIMPGMDGLELARQFSVDRPQTKVLYVTSGNHLALSLLRKPFTEEELLSKVREILDSPDRTAKPAS